MKERIAKLIDLKSILTVIFTLFLGLMLFGNFNPPPEVQSAFLTSFGAIIGYFFNHKKEG